MPTATEDALGSAKWRLGPANVLFDDRSSRFQWGYLLTCQASVAGDCRRAIVSLGAFQPLGPYQLDQGWHLRSPPIRTNHLEHDYYNKPIRLGPGKVTKRGITVCNFFVEPQVPVANDGPGQAVTQMSFALNLQFPK